MKPRLLVVEDNEALAENMLELFVDLGVTARVAADPESACALAADPGFDLALVDLRLGGRDSGLQLLPELRRLSPDGQIILVTGNATLDTAVRAIRQGVFAYVLKPFDPDELLAMGQRALDQISLRKEGERLARDLAESERLYRGVVDAVPAFIVGLDQELRIVFLNDYAKQTSGFRFEQARARRFATVFATSEVESNLSRTLAQALGGRVRRDLEYPLLTRSGEHRVVRWTFIPAHAVARDAELLAVGLDVTERLNLERKAAETRAMAMMGTLTAGLAHEIRNPLNAAKLQLEVMTRGARKVPEEQLREKILGRIEIVGSELSRLSSMLEDFLSLARPRGFQISEVSIVDLLEWVSDLERPVAEQHGVAIEIHLGDDVGKVEGDAPKLKQVLINLVQNSIDAMGGRPGTIQLRASVVDETWLRVCVDDDGPGFSQTGQSVLEPFVTTKEAGTGLGLTIVQNIVAHHGGQVSLGRSESGGARVGFSLRRLGAPTP